MTASPWMAVFLDGNTGKWLCRPTLFRSHMFQSVMWGGSTGGAKPDGVDYAATDSRVFFHADDARPYYAVT